MQSLLLNYYCVQPHQSDTRTYLFHLTIPVIVELIQCKARAAIKPDGRDVMLAGWHWQIKYRKRYTFCSF